MNDELRGALAGYRSFPTGPRAARLAVAAERALDRLEAVRVWAEENYDPYAHEGADTSELVKLLDKKEATG